MLRMNGVTYAAIPAGWGPALVAPRLVIVHKTDNVASAAQEATYAHERDRDAATSCHFYTDPNHILGSVPLPYQAWASRYHGNQAGHQVEICGRSGTFDTGADHQAAVIVARLCALDGVPITHLSTAAGVRSQRGIVGHADITAAYPEDRGDHTDPGWTTAQWRTFVGWVAGKVDRQVIRKGATGDPTRQAQAQLNWRNADHALVLDGDFGPATDRAVRAFQKEQKIKIDGVVGPVTWGKLLP